MDSNSLPSNTSTRPPHQHPFALRLNSGPQASHLANVSCLDSCYPPNVCPSFLPPFISLISRSWVSIPFVLRAPPPPPPPTTPSKLLPTDLAVSQVAEPSSTRARSVPTLQGNRVCLLLLATLLFMCSCSRTPASTRIPVSLPPGPSFAIRRFLLDFRTPKPPLSLLACVFKAADLTPRQLAAPSQRHFISSVPQTSL